MAKIKEPQTLYQLLGIDPQWYLQDYTGSKAGPNAPRALNLKTDEALQVAGFPSQGQMNWTPTKPKYLENSDISGNNTALSKEANEQQAQNTEDDSRGLKLHQSSTIQSAMYWEQHKLLHVSFKSGSSYEYRGVEPDVVYLLEAAASHGSFFHYNIRTSYPYHKV